MRKKWTIQRIKLVILSEDLYSLPPQEKQKLLTPETGKLSLASELVLGPTEMQGAIELFPGIRQGSIWYQKKVVINQHVNNHLTLLFCESSLISMSKISQAKLWCEARESENAAQTLNVKFFAFWSKMSDADT